MHALSGRHRRISVMSDILRATRLHGLAGAALIVVAICANSVPTAKATTSYQVTLTCPIDGQPFTTTLVGSYFQSGMRLDFKPIGALVAPMPHPVCPGNGFVMYQDKFSDGELSAIRSIVLSDDYRRLRAENTDYFIVAYVKQRMASNNYDLVNTYLRASWEAERDAPHLIDSYRRLALQALDTFLSGKRTHSEEWWTAAVIASELERLLGRFDTVELRISALPIDELGASHP